MAISQIEFHSELGCCSPGSFTDLAGGDLATTLDLFFLWLIRASLVYLLLPLGVWSTNLVKVAFLVTHLPPELEIVFTGSWVVTGILTAPWSGFGCRLVRSTGAESSKSK